jgi:hypothetical protein
MTSGLSVDEKRCSIKFGLDGIFSIRNLARQIKSMDILLLFVDKFTLELTNVYVKPKPVVGARPGEHWLPQANNLPSLSRLWNRILPFNVSCPINKHCMDDLAVEVYRLRARAVRKAGQDNVDKLKKDFSQENAKTWAHRAIDANSYSASKCEAKSTEQALMTIGHLVEAPMDFSLDAIVGALLDRSRIIYNLMAVRVEVLDWKSPALKLNSQSPFPCYILVPKPNCTLDTTMYDMWVRFINDTYPGQGLLAVNAALAAAWEELVRVVEGYIDSLLASQERVWSSSDKHIAQRIIWHCRNGSMSCMARMAKGRK